MLDTPDVVNEDNIALQSSPPSYHFQLSTTIYYRYIPCLNRVIEQAILDRPDRQQEVKTEAAERGGV